MVRVRVPGGVLPDRPGPGPGPPRPRSYGEDWLHLTTRQNVELHWVRRPRRARRCSPARASSASRPGRPAATPLRNVMSSEDAGVGLDEPFDCLPDARAGVATPSSPARPSSTCMLPSRINIAFGGSPRCRDDALVNDVGFVSMVRDGVAGYEVWAGGSLGKAPPLSVLLADFVPRADVLAAVRGPRRRVRRPRRPREPGQGPAEVRGRRAWARTASGPPGTRPSPPPACAAHPEPAPRRACSTDVRPGRRSCGVVPTGGWSRRRAPAARRRARPRHRSTLPLGDTVGVRARAARPTWPTATATAPSTLSRDQDVVLRNVPVAAVATIRDRLAARRPVPARRGRTRHRPGLHRLVRVRPRHHRPPPTPGTTLLASAGAAAATRRCGSTSRAARTRAPSTRPATSAWPAPRSASAARPATATTSTSAPTSTSTASARSSGRVAAEDVPAAVDAIVGTWEALRHAVESLGRTVRRIGARRLRRPHRGRRWTTAGPPGPSPSDVARPPARTVAAADRAFAAPVRPARPHPIPPTRPHPTADRAPTRTHRRTAMPIPIPEALDDAAELSPHQGRQSRDLPRYLGLVRPGRRLRRHRRRPAGQRGRPRWSPPATPRPSSSRAPCSASPSPSSSSPAPSCSPATPWS